MPEVNTYLGTRQIIPSYRFEAFDKVVIDGVEHGVASSDGRIHVFVRKEGPAIPQTFSNDQVHELLNAEPSLMEVHSGAYAPAESKLRHSGAALMSELSETQQMKVLVKQEFCRRWLALEANDNSLRRSDKCMEPRIMAICSEILADRKLGFEKKARWKATSVSIDVPPARTLRRWLKIYELANSNAVALRDHFGRSRKQEEFTPEEYGIQQSFAVQYASTKRPTMVFLYKMMRAHINDQNIERTATGQPVLRWPSLKTFQNRINSLPAFFVYAGRYGDKAARAKYAMVTTGVNATYPLERVEADEWNMHLQTLLAQANVWCTLSSEEKAAVERSRLWFSGLIDVATKCVLGFRITRKEPSTESSITALEMAVCDKSRYAIAAGCETPWDMKGKVETVATDSGPAYASLPYQVTVNDLTGSGLLPPSGEAHLRGTVERFFQTMDTIGLSFFTGRTFGSVLAKGDYDSEGNASLCMDTLNKIFIRLIVDVYHNTPHNSLGGETPRNAWLRLSFEHGIIPPPTGDLRRHIFGTNVERKITSEGIPFLGIYFNSPKLQELRRTFHSRNVLVRIDRFDLSGVSVWSSEGWYHVPARLSGLEGVSVWKWVAAAEQLRAINRANTKVSEQVVFRTFKWLEQQASLAQAEAELATPVLNDEHFRKIEQRLTRHITVVEGDKGDDVDFDTLGEWAPSNEFSEFFGVDLAVFKPKPAKPNAKKKAAVKAKRAVASKVDTHHPAVDEDGYVEDEDVDQFGSIIRIRTDF
ncbi:Mu transposase C-terminal domain-containing protein [Phyllobacterium sp. K27]